MRFLKILLIYILSTIAVAVQAIYHENGDYIAVLRNLTTTDLAYRALQDLEPYLERIGTSLYIGRFVKKGNGYVLEKKVQLPGGR